MIAIGKLNEPMTPAEEIKFRQRTREATKSQLAEAIVVLERKHVQALQRLGEKRKSPVFDRKNFSGDAEYYLESNNYDFKSALAEYKSDLAAEIEEAKKNYELRQQNKRGKKHIKKVGDESQGQNQPQPGCFQENCQIF